VRACVRACVRVGVGVGEWVSGWVGVHVRAFAHMRVSECASARVCVVRAGVLPPHKPRIPQRTLVSTNPDLSLSLLCVCARARGVCACVRVCVRACVRVVRIVLSARCPTAALTRLTRPTRLTRLTRLTWRTCASTLEPP